MTQKDAVFSVVTATIANAGIDFKIGIDNAANVLTRELRATINDELSAMFLDGQVEISDEARTKLSNTSELRAYVSGLVSNWVRKDNRLSGSTVSTTLQSDPQLRALKKLQRSQTDPSHRLEIQNFINKRTSELGG